MAITGIARWDDESLVNGDNSTASVQWILTSDSPKNDTYPDGDERIDAMNWLENNAPDELYGLFYTEVKVDKLLHESEHEAKWAGVAEYTRPDKQKPRKPQTDRTKSKTDPQEVILTIRSGSGETLTMTSSKALVDSIYRPREGSGPEFWDWSGEPQLETLLGVESSKEDDWTMFKAKGIPIRTGTVEVVAKTTRLSAAIIEDGYLVTAALSAGKSVVNSVPYRGFPVRSLRMINFDAQQQGRKITEVLLTNVEPWECTFTFQYSPEITYDELNAARPPGLNEPGITWIENPSTNQGVKRGWDYLEYVYVPSVIDYKGAKFVMPQARRGGIHQIYEEVDFADVFKI